MVVYPRFFRPMRQPTLAFFVTISALFSWDAVAAPTPEGQDATSTPTPAPLNPDLETNSIPPAAPEPSPLEPAVAEPAPLPAVPPAPPVAAAADPSAPVVATPTPTGIDPTLLDTTVSDSSAPVATAPHPANPTGLSPEERTAAIESAYASQYRPADNPMHLNIAGRVLFANVGGRHNVNGRIGGASIDIGPAWNRLGIAASVTGWGGRIALAPDSNAEINAMLGGGLSLSLGRLALLTHGFVDLRVGYDIYYGAVNARGTAPTVVTMAGDSPPIQATLTENLLPHGPRVRVDLGLVGSNAGRRFQGFGLSMGYQALVGSLRGQMPSTNILTLGLSYWMG